MPLVLLQALALPRPLAPMADWCSFDDSDEYIRRTTRDWHLMCELCVLEKMLLASGMTPEELIENRAPWRRWDPLPPGNCEAWDRAFPPGSPAPPSDSDSEPASPPASPRLEPYVPGASSKAPPPAPPTPKASRASSSSAPAPPASPRAESEAPPPRKARRTS